MRAKGLGTDAKGVDMRAKGADMRANALCARDRRLGAAGNARVLWDFPLITWVGADVGVVWVAGRDEIFCFKSCGVWTCLPHWVYTRRNMLSAYATELYERTHEQCELIYARCEVQRERMAQARQLINNSRLWLTYKRLKQEQREIDRVVRRLLSE